MTPGTGAALAWLAQEQEDREHERWLNNGGRKKIEALRARFEAEAKLHPPPQFETRHTPAGTPYRVLVRLGGTE